MTTQVTPSLHIFHHGVPSNLIHHRMISCIIKDVDLFACTLPLFLWFGHISLYISEKRFILLHVALRMAVPKTRGTRYSYGSIWLGRDVYRQ